MYPLTSLLVVYITYNHTQKEIQHTYIMLFVYFILKKYTHAKYAKIYCSYGKINAAMVKLMRSYLTDS